MNENEKKSTLLSISNLKKELLLIRIKASSGESISIKSYKEKKKEVARLFTKINSSN
jgi:ribosomal protein L29